MEKKLNYGAAISLLLLQCGCSNSVDNTYQNDDLRNAITERREVLKKSHAKKEVDKSIMKAKYPDIYRGMYGDK
jgi:hypothetical protein